MARRATSIFDSRLSRANSAGASAGIYVFLPAIERVAQPVLQAGLRLISSPVGVSCATVVLNCADILIKNIIPCGKK